MKQTLYSLHSGIDRTGAYEHRVTKFVDGEVESSYLTTQTECECPAGHRPSCRHRQMLPQMLAAGIANTHWFWDFDLGRVVDFDGQLKSNLDAMNELAPIPGVTILDLSDMGAVHNAIADAVGEPTLPAGPQDVTMTAECPPGCCEPFPESIVVAKPRNWRRL